MAESSIFAPPARRFTPAAQLAAQRAENLAASMQGSKPQYLPPSEATTSDWSITVPGWCADQRNQMTGPADDAELVVKMLNSGAPGVMLDLEDSMANRWANLQLGYTNLLAALHGTLTYVDQKRDSTVGIKESRTVTWIRARGLHINQAGVIRDELMSASLFDVATIAPVDIPRMRHPLAFYIPKSESPRGSLVA